MVSPKNFLDHKICADIFLPKNGPFCIGRKCLSASRKQLWSFCFCCFSSPLRLICGTEMSTTNAIAPLNRRTGEKNSVAFGVADCLFDFFCSKGNFKTSNFWNNFWTWFNYFSQFFWTYPVVQLDRIRQSKNHAYLLYGHQKNKTVAKLI